MINEYGAVFCTAEDTSDGATWQQVDDANGTRIVSFAAAFSSPRIGVVTEGARARVVRGTVVDNDDGIRWLRGGTVRDTLAVNVAALLRRCCTASLCVARCDRGRGVRGVTRLPSTAPPCIAGPVRQVQYGDRDGVQGR